MRIASGTLAAALLLGTTAAALAANPPPLTRQQALYDAGAAGYTYISNLKQDAHGDWTGAGHQGAFIVQPNGKVVPQK